VAAFGGDTVPDRRRKLRGRKKGGTGTPGCWEPGGSGKKVPAPHTHTIKSSKFNENLVACKVGGTIALNSESVSKKKTQNRRGGGGGSTTSVNDLPLHGIKTLRQPCITRFETEKQGGPLDGSHTQWKLEIVQCQEPKKKQK